MKTSYKLAVFMTGVFLVTGFFSNCQQAVGTPILPGKPAGYSDTRVSSLTQISGRWKAVAITDPSELFTMDIEYSFDPAKITSDATIDYTTFFSTMPPETASSMWELMKDAFSPESVGFTGAVITFPADYIIKAVVEITDPADIAQAFSQMAIYKHTVDSNKFVLYNEANQQWTVFTKVT